MNPLAIHRQKKLFFKSLAAARRRQLLQRAILLLMNEKQTRLLKSLFILQLLLVALRHALATVPGPRVRSCRRVVSKWLVEPCVVNLL